MKLHPCWYKWIEHSHDREHSGFLAQDVERDLGAQAASKWGFFVHEPASIETNINAEGKDETVEKPDKYGLRYQELIGPLVGAMQAMHEKFLLLQQQVETLTKQIEELTQESAL
jgi:hypothetical protein